MSSAVPSDVRLVQYLAALGAIEPDLALNRVVERLVIEEGADAVLIERELQALLGTLDQDLPSWEVIACVLDRLCGFCSPQNSLVQYRHAD